MSLTSVGQVLGYCDHGGAYLARNKKNGGVGMWCDQCQRWVTRESGFDRMWLGRDHPALVGKNVAALPEIGERLWQRCQGPCGELAHCELHHTAPRQFFGDDCDRWPLVWLCRPCHDRWHTLVTPGLCTTYDPAKHAQTLLDYLGMDKGRALTQALIQAWKARRGEAA